MFNSEGGGYFDQTANLDSPGGTDKKQDAPKRAQMLFPIVIGMLKECQSDEFQIWDEQVNIVKIVGIVRSLEITSTKITYDIEDQTGNISAVYWLEQESKKQAQIPVDKEGIYVELYGTIRSQGEEKIVMVLKIKPITTMNIITTHLLEVIHIRYQMEHNINNESSMVKSNNPGVSLSNSMMSFSNTNGQSDAGYGMSATQSKVFKLIKSCETRVGIHRDHIHEQFPTNEHKEVEDAIEFLVSEGHVFSTINSDHFKVTDI